MNSSISSPSIPATSDLFDYNQKDDDDLEAIQLIRNETTLKNKKEGKVIQHRAWPVPEAFRSECDYPQETPSRPNPFVQQTPSSSPPVQSDEMHASSPIGYPASSSPPQQKRPNKSNESPLKEQTAGKQNRPKKTMAGFLEDSSDEDEEPARKKRMVSREESVPVENIVQEEIVDDEDEDAIEALNSMEGVDVPQQEPRKSLFANIRPQEKPKSLFAGSPQPEKSGSLFAKFKKPPPKPITSTENEDSSDEGPEESIKDKDAGFETLLQDTDSFSTEYPMISSLLRSRITAGTPLRTCSGKSFSIQQRKKSTAVAFEQLVAARSTTRAGRAKKSYYGIDVQELIEEAKSEAAISKKIAEEAQKVPAIPLPSVEKSSTRPKKTMMWTEKYRARKFTDLVGDDRTHRQVLKWLKAWDPIVFPRAGTSKSKPAVKKFGATEEEVEKAQRKILLLTGPPGLGKTTLAHVCARQAGYEVMEINASDDRSSNVVKGRIRDSVGTESVKTVTGTTAGKSARPVCVVVDEVDGVVSGSGGSGGEGGFINALIDLLVLDQKNSSSLGVSTVSTKKKRGDKDKFRLMRPIILICNDLYHPSLRPIRQSAYAEIIHLRPPPLDAVISRMSSVFAKEGIEADTDGVRRLCEATWGMSAGAKQSGREASGTGEGDLRGILVVGESVARQLKVSSSKTKLTRKWVEQNMISTLSSSGSGARGIGRGGTREIVQRIYMEGGGFPKPTFAVPTGKAAKSYKLAEQPKTKLGVAEIGLKASMERLREMIETSGEIERVLTDVFSSYPEQNFQDDTFLSKPDTAYEWFSFHDTCSSRVYANQEWELLPYLSQPILACHTLFSSSSRHQNWNDAGPNHSKFSKNGLSSSDDPEIKPLPFTGLLADHSARETEKANLALLHTIRASLSAPLTRSFLRPSSIAVELAPYIMRILTPSIKPVIVGGSNGGMNIASVRKESEKNMVRRAVDVMNEVGVTFEKGRLEEEGEIGGGKYAPTQWVFRMEPAMDELTTFETLDETKSNVVAARYAVRQVLDQEYRKSIIVREAASRQARYLSGNASTTLDRPTSSDGILANPPVLDRKNTTQMTGRLKAHVEVEERVVVEKRDFFGRLLGTSAGSGSGPGGRGGNNGGRGMVKGGSKDLNKVWVSYHEGFSNAVRRPVSVEDILRGL